MKKIIAFFTLLIVATATVFCQAVSDTDVSTSFIDTIVNFIVGNYNVSSALVVILGGIYALIEYILGKTKLIKPNSVPDLIIQFVVAIIKGILGKKQPKIAKNADLNPSKPGGNG